MLTMGDEVLRSQGGNNNAYCQDNELSWFDWSAVISEADMLRFTSQLIAARRRAQELLDLPVDVTLEELLATARIDWHGIELGRPDRADSSRSLAATIQGRSVALHIIANAYWRTLEFALPPTEDGAWQRVVDTTLASPDDIRLGDEAPSVAAPSYRVGPRSVVVLAARTPTPSVQEVQP
jgi:glycogen operon protein